MTAAAVAQLVLDYEESARLEDVADYFHLTVDDVTAALEYCWSHFERLRAQGWLTR